MNKKILTGLILSTFILLIISTVFLLQQLKDARQIDPLELEMSSKEDIIQHIYENQNETKLTPFLFIPIFGFFGLVVGLLIYYILFTQIEKKEELIKYNTEIILHLLDSNERKVIRKIVDEGGKIQQIEITYMQGFTKVKAHRILDNLEKKGIIFKEKLGKMRMIKLHSDFYTILKNKN